MDFSGLSSEQACDGGMAEFASLPTDYCPHVPDCEPQCTMSTESLLSDDNVLASIGSSYSSQGYDLVCEDDTASLSPHEVQASRFVPDDSWRETQSNTETCSKNTGLEHIPSVRVLSHLDSILRDKVQQAMDELNTGLHQSLDTHLWHVQHLLSLSQQPIKPPTSPTVLKSLSEPILLDTSGVCGDNATCLCRQESAASIQKTEYLSEMLTKALAITNTLHREEFSL